MNFSRSAAHRHQIFPVFVLFYEVRGDIIGVSDIIVIILYDDSQCTILALKCTVISEIIGIHFLLLY